MNCLYRLVLLLLCSPLAACLSLPKSNPPVVLSPLPIAAEPVESSLPLQVAVSEPQALAIWQGDQILVRTGSGSLGILAGVRWSDDNAYLIQHTLIDALRARGGLAGVGRPADGSRADWLLLSQIERFELDYASAPASAELDLSLRVVDIGSGRNLALQRFSGSAALPATAEPGSLARSEAHAAVLLDLLHEQSLAAADWLRAQAEAKAAVDRPAALTDGFEQD